MQTKLLHRCMCVYKVYITIERDAIISRHVCLQCVQYCPVDTGYNIFFRNNDTMSNRWQLQQYHIMENLSLGELPFSWQLFCSNFPINNTIPALVTMTTLTVPIWGDSLCKESLLKRKRWKGRFNEASNTKLGIWIQILKSQPWRSFSYSGKQNRSNLVSNAEARSETKARKGIC